jgi:hypothetical protein
MVPELRRAFNQSFTQEKFNLFLKDINQLHPHAINFKIAQTPVFISKELGKKIIDTCEDIIDTILLPSFKTITQPSIPTDQYTANENEYSTMMAFDFAIGLEDKKKPEPQLIEMQGFPSLFGFQVYYQEVLRKHFNIPSTYSAFLNGYEKDTYLQDLKSIIIGHHHPEEVILLDIQPHLQKTKIDFYCTQDYLGLPIVCITEVIKKGRSLYYSQKGKIKPIKRIYNRVVIDEWLLQKNTLAATLPLFEDTAVEWIPHPNWFYRISKYTLPFIHHPNVPLTHFLTDMVSIPSNLHNYVLKPLFSFGGRGVVVNVTPQHLKNIKDPANWILQRKVAYAPIIETPTTLAKVEVRIMYWWKDGATRPVPAINLCRLSKGAMMGVGYNQQEDWVGGSIVFFEQ